MKRILRLLAAALAFAAFGAQATTNFNEGTLNAGGSFSETLARTVGPDHFFFSLSYPGSHTFISTLTLDTGTAGGLLVSLFNDIGVLGVANPLSGLIGSFGTTVSGGGSASESFFLPSGNYYLSVAGQTLPFPGSYTLTAYAVPEPAGILMGLAGLGVFFGLRRRSRSKSSSLLSSTGGPRLLQPSSSVAAV